LDLASILGIILGFVALVVTTLMGAPDLAAAATLISVQSVILVLGGAVFSSMISFPLSLFITAMKAQKFVFKPPNLDPAEAINKIVGLANTARKEGVLALEDSVAAMDDEFLKKGVMLIVDGTDPDLVKAIMETELMYIEERHGAIAGVFESIATYAPSWGMKGTLISLILMLNDLSDMDALGPNMAVAMITTFYGAIVASLWGNPFSTKLKGISKDEVVLKTVLIEGMLSIQAGENPRIIEEKLKSFLAPAARSTVGAPGGEGGGGGDE